jgi:4-amino-4-deoxy-L-arabinose transferase-like glycosyltransferase
LEKLKRSFVFSSAKFVLILIVFLTVIYIGIGGVDFGYHQDEQNTTGLVNKYIRTGNILPSWYAYPSLTTYLPVFATVPYAIPYVAHYGFDPKLLKNYVLKNVVRGNSTFLLNIRKVFILTASASVLWVYLVCLAWGRTWKEALLAASLLGFSWEVGYHSRWVAPDAIMMQFGVLAILLTMIGVRQDKGRLKWFILSAAAAGLATSTKYPGGLLIVPVGVAVFLFREKDSSVRILLRNLILVSVVFIIAYLVMTPGTILEFDIFIENVLGEIGHYARGHGPHTVGAGWEHFTLIITYLSRVVFSPYQPIAIFFFMASILGGWAIFKESPYQALVFICFPLLYIFYFSSQKVMFVRNLLVLVPFLAVLSARGIFAIFGWLKKPKFNLAFTLMITAMLAMNIYWGMQAMRSIQLIGTNADIQILAREIKSNPQLTYLLSDHVWQVLEPFAPFENAVRTPSERVDRVAFYSDEMKKPGVWPINRPGSAPRSLGPFEINLDYYAGWQGENRILITTPDRAEQIGVLISK